MTADQEAVRRGGMCRYGDAGSVERGLCLYHLWLESPRNGPMFKGKESTNADGERVHTDLNESEISRDR